MFGHKEQPGFDAKAASTCVITQDRFKNSVKTDRENEMNDWDRLGRKKPITHLIRQESIKPCGAVTGAWAADSHGHVTFNTLIVQTPDGKRMPFERMVLRDLVKRIDLDIQTKRQQPTR